ncbi:uncharacterized protein JCM10292_005623 [Rhodotorula paludigena]|uniref:uncharacterized protein n=1 Tax=Rhodotorula paludigena TaxID=86838 RepID=UPI00316DAF3A
MHAEAPPAYSEPAQPPASLSPLERLPSHLLLRVLAHCALQDLVFALKPASRTLYLHAITLAREQVHPLWRDELHRAAAARGRAAPSSDPLGMRGDAHTRWESAILPPPSYDLHAPAATTSSLLASRSRELAVYDHFVAALALSARRLCASSLLFTSEDDALQLPGDVRTDLWGLMQPRARCEDLLLAEGRRAGWVAGTGEKQREGQVEATDVRVELRNSEARLLLPTTSGGSRVSWRGVVAVPRSAQDPLEDVACRLAGELARAYIQRGGDAIGNRWYDVRV